MQYNQIKQIGKIAFRADINLYKWFLCGSLTLTTCQICQNQGCEGIKRWCRLSTPRRATVYGWRCVLTVLCKWSIATQNWLHYVQIVCARPAAGELGEPRHGLILARHLARPSITSVVSSVIRRNRQNCPVCRVWCVQSSYAIMLNFSHHSRFLEEYFPCHYK